MNFKKVILLFGILFISLFVKGQLQGTFQKLNDGYTYFCLQNTSMYNLPIVWAVVNDSNNEMKSGQTIVNAGGVLYFGPSTIGWTWMNGERCVVALNGQQYQWKYSSSNPTFQGKWRTIKGLKCPNHTYAGENEWNFTYESVGGMQPNDGTRCEICNYIKSSHTDVR